MAASLPGGASDGITITDGMSSSRAASAIACAWLPDENAITPARRCSGVELRQRVVGAAKLERTHALQVLALEEQLRTRALVGQARGHHRRLVRHASQAVGRGANVLQRDRQRHALSIAWRNDTP